MNIRCPSCEVIIRMKEESRPPPGQRARVTCPKCGKQSNFTQPLVDTLIQEQRRWVAEKVYDYSVKN